MMPRELPPEENMDLIPEEDEEPVSEEGDLDRREFFDLTLKWSKAALAAILAGTVIAGLDKEAEAGAWVNRRGSWANRRGGGQAGSTAAAAEAG